MVPDSQTDLRKMSLFTSKNGKSHDPGHQKAHQLQNMSKITLRHIVIKVLIIVIVCLKVTRDKRYYMCRGSKIKITAGFLY